MLRGAEVILRHAIDSGHSYAAPTALVNLGGLLQARGDAEGS